jgi:hypothetical protein
VHAKATKKKNRAKKNLSRQHEKRNNCATHHHTPLFNFFLTSFLILDLLLDLFDGVTRLDICFGWRAPRR